MALSSTEVWKPYPNNTEIQVSSFGNIKLKNCNPRFFINHRGYKYLVYKKKFYSIHRIVALTFIPNPHNLPQINHIDCDKLNNQMENLEWVTNSDNQLHSYRHHNRKMRPVQQIDPLTNTVIKTFKSMSQAERILGLKKYSVRDVVEGNKKESGGFIFKRVDEFN